MVLRFSGYFLDGDIRAYSRLDAGSPDLGDLGGGEVAGPIKAIGLSSNLKTSWQRAACVQANTADAPLQSAFVKYCEVISIAPG